jgi:hypothetical protein
MVVSTINRIGIGETIRFGVDKPLQVGMIVGLKTQLPHFGPEYGLARVTEDLGNGFYEAERIK